MTPVLSPPRARLVAAGMKLVDARLPYGFVLREEWDRDAMPMGLDCSSFVCRAVRDAGVVVADLAAHAGWMYEHLPAASSPMSGDLAVFRRRGGHELGVSQDGFLYHVMLVAAPGVLIGTCAESPQGDEEPGGTFRCGLHDHPGGWEFVAYRKLISD